MTSLGLLQYSDINESSPIGGNITGIEKKRQARHNITVKKRPAEETTNNNNVQNMLNLINDTNGYDDDSGNGGLADFNPPPRAEVSSKTPPLKNSLAQQQQPQQQLLEQREKNIDYDEKPIIVNEPQTNASDIPLNNNTNDVKPRQYPAPLDSQEGFASLPKTYANDFYKQYVPYFNQTTNQGTNNRDQMLDKLNYMIHLLEEQKDEKTGHVMEEVILYSFLGVFIIFIVDSFARAGKYTR
jgi:hypothetical protein